MVGPHRLGERLPVRIYEVGRSLVVIARGIVIDVGWIVAPYIFYWGASRIIRTIVNNKEYRMLEGKEVDVKIGNIGHVSVDINDKLELEVALSAKVDLFAEIVKLTKKTDTQIDDAGAKLLGSLFNRKPEEVLAAVAVA